MDGVINVLKPPGMTSHDVIQFIRKLVGQRKVGHTGTLDPGAAGVLAVCLGKATKIIQYLNHDKQYRAEITFGKATSTQDSFGEVIREVDCSSLTIDVIKRGLEGFQGDIKQIPPMTSAVKHKGKKLYELARAGQNVERKPRRVKVYSASVVETRDLGTSCPRAMLDISCTAGTYIRTICFDLGESLGYCAYMSFLLRMGAGTLKIDNALTLEELQKMKQEGSLYNAVISIDEALDNLPVVLLQENAVRPAQNGNRVSGLIKNNKLGVDQFVRIQGPDGVLAIGKALNDTFDGKSIEVQPVRVLV